MRVDLIGQLSVVGLAVPETTCVVLVERIFRWGRGSLSFRSWWNPFESSKYVQVSVDSRSKFSNLKKNKNYGKLFSADMHPLKQSVKVSKILVGNWHSAKACKPDFQLILGALTRRSAVKYFVQTDVLRQIRFCVNDKICTEPIPHLCRTCFQ